jgi:capsular exopolysaccharide synthesis family protein
MIQPDLPTEIDSRLVAVLRPASWETERYRMLRRALERRYEPERRRVVAVTSASPGEGKSTTALNLAAVLAESKDAAVLVIDADLRCSSVARILGLDDAGPDLGDAIRDETMSIHAVTRYSPSVPFAIVPARPRPADAHELVESPRVAQLIGEARQAYHHVIIDAPPLMPVSDCRALARWIDGFVLVVAAHETTREVFGEALSLLEPQKVLGIVLNGADGPAWSRNHRYYAHYPPIR